MKSQIAIKVEKVLLEHLGEGINDTPQTYLTLDDIHNS